MGHGLPPHRLPPGRIQWNAHGRAAGEEPGPPHGLVRLGPVRRAARGSDRESETRPPLPGPLGLDGHAPVGPGPALPVPVQPDPARTPGLRSALHRLPGRTRAAPTHSPGTGTTDSGAATRRFPAVGPPFGGPREGPVV